MAAAGLGGVVAVGLLVVGVAQQKTRRAGQEGEG